MNLVLAELPRHSSMLKVPDYVDRSKLQIIGSRKQYPGRLYTT